jgi:hypothetical protein
MIYAYVLEFTQCAIQAVSIIISFFHSVGKAGGTQIQRCQGIAVKCYGGTLGALAQAPSGFCDAGANADHLIETSGRLFMYLFTGLN